MEEVEPLIKNHSKPLKDDFTKVPIEPIFINTLKEFMTESEYLNCFREHLSPMIPKLTLNQHDLIEVYDLVFRKKLLLYAKAAKLHNGEKMMSRIVELDIKLFQDFSCQVIEPVLRRDLPVLMRTKLESWFDVDPRVDSVAQLGQYSSLTMIGTCGEAIRSSFLILYKILNFMYLIEKCRELHNRTGGSFNLEAWLKQFHQSQEDSSKPTPSQQIMDGFLQGIIHKFFNTTLTKKFLRSIISTEWADSEFCDGVFRMLFEDIFYSVILKHTQYLEPLLGHCHRLIFPLNLSSRLRTYLIAVSSSNPEYNNNIPLLLRRFNEAAQKIIAELPKLVNKDLELCSVTLLNMVECIQNEKWADCKSQYEEFRTSLNNSKDSFQTLVESFNAKYVQEPVPDSSGFVVLTEKNPVDWFNSNNC